MDKDSEIRRLREYIHLQLRREMKGNNNERSRIFFLSKESVIESRKSKIRSLSEWEARRNKKAQQDNARNKERIKKIIKEIGRNLHSVNGGPISFDKVYSDVEINIFPVNAGGQYQVILKSKDTELTKQFANEEEAKLWARNTAQQLSKNFTQ